MLLQPRRSLLHSNVGSAIDPSPGDDFPPAEEDENVKYTFDPPLGKLQRIEDVDDDGYKEIFPDRDLHPFQTIKSTPKFLFALSEATARNVKEFLLNVLTLKSSSKKKVGTLILLRHGESLWNENKTFTGWSDPDLSDRGIREVAHAARLLVESGYRFDMIYTSRLKRAVRSVWLLLQELDLIYLPVFKSWRLNERHYGALQGLSKVETTKILGSEIVAKWRGGLFDRPPAASRDSPQYPGNNRAFADLRRDQLPTTESLHDCMCRSEPLWHNRIACDLRQGRDVCVVAHGNSLRGLVKIIDNITDANIEMVAIPTSIPIIYNFDLTRTGDLVPIKIADKGANLVKLGAGNSTVAKWSQVSTGRSTERCLP